MEQDVIQKRTIELIRLPNLDLTSRETMAPNDMREKRLATRIHEKIKSLMEPDKFYVVSVDSSYVSGRKGHVRRKTTHYLATLVGSKNDLVQLSSYPTWVFGEPERFFA